LYILKKVPYAKLIFMQLLLDRQIVELFFLSCFRVAMDQLSGLQPSLLAHHQQQQEVLSQGGSSGRSTPSSDSAPGKLFVGGLSWQTTQAQPYLGDARASV
jgi:hypothetical protein